MRHLNSLKIFHPYFDSKKMIMCGTVSTVYCTPHTEKKMNTVHDC